MIRLVPANIKVGLNRIRKQVNIQKDVVGSPPTSCMWVANGCMWVPSQSAGPKDKAG